jgi:hypothetical protein
MRHLFLFVFLLLAGIGVAQCAETSPEEVAAVPFNVKDQALQKTLEYGQELFLRQDLDQATRLFKRVLTLDPCNKEARDGLLALAYKSSDPKNINDFVESQKCPSPPIPKPQTEASKTTTIKDQNPAKPSGESQPTSPLGTSTDKMSASKEISASTPVAAAPARATPPAPQQALLHEADLQKKIADMQDKVQRIETSAQAQNARLDKLTNEQPMTRN